MLLLSGVIVLIVVGCSGAGSPTEIDAKNADTLRSSVLEIASDLNEGDRLKLAQGLQLVLVSDSGEGFDRDRFPDKTRTLFPDVSLSSLDYSLIALTSAESLSGISLFEIHDLASEIRRTETLDRLAELRKRAERVAICVDEEKRCTQRAMTPEANPTAYNSPNIRFNMDACNRASDGVSEWKRSLSEAEQKVQGYDFKKATEESPFPFSFWMQNSRIDVGTCDGYGGNFCPDEVLQARRNRDWECRVVTR